MKKHVLILTERWYPDTFGGSERVAALQVDGLLAAGFRVTVFSANPVDGLTADETTGDLRVVRAGSNREMPGQAMYSILVACKPRLQQLLAEEQFDVVLCHHPLIGDTYLDVATTAVPLLYLFHSSRPQEIRFEGLGRKTPLHWLWQRVVAWQAGRSELRVLTASTEIFYLSKFSGSIIETEYPQFAEKATYLQPGIDPGEFTAPASRDWSKNLFFTVRRLTPRMGLDTLIDAAAIVRDAGHEFTLHIAGTGPLQDTLNKKITQLNLSDSVQLLGRISDADLVTAYQTATCFVLPTSGLEGLGIVTLEAMHSGLPVLGTPAGATPELLNLIDTDLVFAGTDAQSIARGMLWYLERTAAEREGLGKTAVTVAKGRFTAQQMNAQLVPAVQAVLAKTTTKS